MGGRVLQIKKCLFIYLYVHVQHLCGAPFWATQTVGLSMSLSSLLHFAFILVDVTSDDFSKHSDPYQSDLSQL